MIARHESTEGRDNLWAQLAAPLDPSAISWRQDGRPIARDGRHIARFVAYIEANTVFERLDSVVPGEWDSTLELLPAVVGLDEDANQGACSFKCRLQVLGVIREDVGTGKDYKQAATDAFKRAAVRFGVGRELYNYEQNWVQLDGDGKFAKPVEDPAAAYARRYGKLGGQAAPRPTSTSNASADATSTRSSESAHTTTSSAPSSTPTAQSATGSGPLALDEESCPKCGGRMWDNRLTKKNPKAPDFKCRDRACDGVIWPPKGEKAEATSRREPTLATDDEIPF